MESICNVCTNAWSNAMGTGWEQVLVLARRPGTKLKTNSTACQVLRRTQDRLGPRLGQATLKAAVQWQLVALMIRSPGDSVACGTATPEPLLSSNINFLIPPCPQIIMLERAV